MRYFLALFIVFFIQAKANAKVCLKEAAEYKKKGVHHILISFEGLMSYNAGFVRKTLVEDLKKQNQFFSKNFSYTSVDKAFECLNDWDNIFKENYKISVIGHSFGGGIATFKLLEKAKNVYFDNVITLDPRSWTSDFEARKKKSLFVFSKPKNVGKFINFFQRGGMPGYLVEGAENHELKNTTHTKVPAHPKVLSLSECRIFNNCN